MEKVKQLLVIVGIALLTCGNVYADNSSGASAGAQSGSSSQAVGNGIVGQTVSGGDGGTGGAGGDAAAFAGVNQTNALASQSGASGNSTDIKTDVTNNFITNVPKDTHTTATVDGTQTIKNVPGMGSPGLTTSMSETCMGSTSASVAIAGLGIGGGKTYTDNDCVNRLNAREIMHEGQPGAKEIAKEILCTNDVVRMASKKAGYPCADDIPASSGPVSALPNKGQNMSAINPPAAVKVYPQLAASIKGSILDDGRFTY